MTLDELLAGLQKGHGDDWPRWAFEEFRILDQLGANTQLFFDLWKWIQQMVAAGVVATWQPGPEVWASVPPDAMWVVGQPDGCLNAWVEKPGILCDCWWTTAGKRWILPVEMPRGVDWRQACWKRPEAQP